MARIVQLLTRPFLMRSVNTTTQSRARESEGTQRLTVRLRLKLLLRQSGRNRGALSPVEGALSIRDVVKGIESLFGLALNLAVHTQKG